MIASYKISLTFRYSDLKIYLPSVPCVEQILSSCSVFIDQLELKSNPVQNITCTSLNAYQMENKNRKIYRCSSTVKHCIVCLIVTQNEFPLYI
jgi:hypothetical protein